MKHSGIAGGGGTGGYIFPLIAVAQEIRKQTAPYEINIDMRYLDPHINTQMKLSITT